MVRRWRNEAHARHRVTQRANVFSNLAAWQLTAFTGLGTLGHLDLNLVSRHQVFSRDTKTARRNLLDFGTQRITVLQRQIDFYNFLANHAFQGFAFFDRDAFELLTVAVRVFTTLTRVTFAADAVHGNSQRGVGFRADGTQRHGTCGKAFHDFFGRLNLVNRDGLAQVNLELKQAAQRHVATVLVVDQLCVFFVGVEVVGTRGMLQLGNRVRRPHVVFTTHAEGIFAACIEHVGQHRVITEGRAVHAQRLFSNLEHAHAFNLAGRAGEELGNRLAAQANRFK